jgi:uncharacterized membrane protein
MLNLNSMFTGLAIGAGAMYFFDAAHGRRRRKLVADQFNHLLHQASNDLDASWRDLSNRAQGAVAEARGMLRADDANDETVCHRVRAVMGHFVTNAHEIEVGSTNGHVVLRGPIRRMELPALLAAVGTVKGVRTVTDELVVQGEAAGDGEGTLDLVSSLNCNLSPGMKLVMGTAGGVLLANCMLARRRSLTDLVLGFAGFGMLTQAVATRNVGNRMGRMVEFHKTVHINAPASTVFDFIFNMENLMLISDKVHDVRMDDTGRITKSIGFPGGLSLRMAERITCLEKDKCLSTRSEPDSMLQYEKHLRLQQEGDEGTRVHLHFIYSPPGGVIGHAAAAAFGLDAKSFFDDLMMRMKTYLETGVQPHDVRRLGGEHSRSATDDVRQEEEAQSHERGLASGPNVPPHDKAPHMGGRTETDQIGPINRDIASGAEAEHTAMRNHI